MSHYLEKYKVIRNTEFIDKDSVEKCLAQKGDLSTFIAKRFGKPKIWRHPGRVISPRLELELRSHWP